MPSQQNQLYRDVAVQHGMDLVDTVHLMAMGSLTTADAGIACFDSKYNALAWRPYSAIRNADLDGNRGNDRGPGLDAAALDAEPSRIPGSARLRHVSSGGRARERPRDADDRRNGLGCDRRRHDLDDDRAFRHHATAQGRGRQRPSLGRTALAQLSRRRREPRRLGCRLVAQPLLRLDSPTEPTAATDVVVWWGLQ